MSRKQQVKNIRIEGRKNRNTRNTKNKEGRKGGKKEGMEENKVGNKTGM